MTLAPGRQFEEPEVPSYFRPESDPTGNGNEIPDRGFIPVTIL
jgi:hypothetical protein